MNKRLCREGCGKQVYKSGLCKRHGSPVRDPADVAKKAAKQVEGRKRGQEIITRAMVSRGRGPSAPLRYRLRLHELMVSMNETRVRADTGLSDITLYRVLAGASISPGTLARLTLFFDGPDAAELFLKHQSQVNADRIADEIEEAG